MDPAKKRIISNVSPVILTKAENVTDSTDSLPTFTYVHINENSVQNTILDHPYPVMSLGERIICLTNSKTNNMSTILQKDNLENQCTEFHIISDTDADNFMTVENLPNVENNGNEASEISNPSVKNHEDDESIPNINIEAEEKIPMTKGEVKLLINQQEQLINQQGQILQVLQELTEIQREMLELKRKNHELKLTKLRISAQQAGMKILTKASK